MDKQFDVIIVGTGVAGLYGALYYPDDISVLLLSKRELALSNSSFAQGGVAAVLDKNHDNYKLHIADTLIAGKYKNSLSAVEKLVTEGPEDVLKLKDFGVEFDRDKFGRLLATLEGGHSRNRIVHHKDSTGKEIVDKLLKAASEKENITILDNSLVYSLDKSENGFYVGVLRNGENLVFGSSYCVLATGGIGRVYQYTTNSAIATGDGITFAHLLGGKIAHLSRVQFHPTAFDSKTDRERFLISEAVRGEGAILLNCNGERFMFNYDERGELAPRDVVSSAIMQEEKRTGSCSFYLDITHKDAKFLKNRFPMIYNKCLDKNIDITKDKIPIYPCQHYLMGGIAVDLDARTTVDRLYACGECSHTGVHGANRLASNSLLEALVFSRRAALDISNRINKESRKPIGTEPKKQDISGKKLPKGIRTRIREIMQKTYFVNPDLTNIEEAYKEVDNILTDLISAKYEISVDYVEARSLATVAGIILQEIKEGINL
ncbi:MAG: L-aspartate oxidase [Oscillospiraceae bacterium]|nr:L-aspartate oxidase [Oscillospiraceae bacterium]